MKLTLVFAYDFAEPKDSRVNLFYVGHQDEVVDVQIAVQQAFLSWAGTDSGTEYLRSHGTNWGDALNIPEWCLRLQGLTVIGPVMHDQVGGFRLAPVCFDTEILVDFNECLLES